MKPIRQVSSTVTPLNYKNVDTDQIISKEFLKRIERTGFGQFLFYHWRFDEEGHPKGDFVLNDPKYEGSQILVAHDNFGCGSSREHAPWALQDYGFDVIIAPSFADIFHNNCYKNGILPIELPVDVVEHLLEKGKEETYQISVDLERQVVETSEGEEYPFEIDEYNKKMLLNGWDEISLTFQYEDKIAAYEEKHQPLEE